MERGSTNILRGVIVLVGLAVLAFCLLALPYGILTDKTGWYRPILMGMYLPAVPFFIGLFQALKLLNYIDKNKAFSQASVDALKNIKYCAASVSAIYTAGMPYIFWVADRDDAPGVVAIGLVIIFAAFVVSIAAAVFERLFQSAVDLKNENDLTV